MTDEEETDVDDIVEEALSKQRSVKDILVEMKDTSELMVDLAYSSLLTNSEDIAEEVEELEERMDNLQYEIETMLFLAARTPEDAADLSGILHVARASEDIANAADDIVDVVQRGVGDHPIYHSFLGETEEKVVRVAICPGSDFIGKKIGEFRVLTKTGCYIRAIRRKKDWIYNPNKNTELNVDDILIVIGSESALKELRGLTGEEGVCEKEED
ncbi:MAG: TrkA C-terminal domain-containing protein [Candidatus Altiarchaeota archaeon]